MPNPDSSRGGGIDDCLLSYGNQLLHPLIDRHRAAGLMLSRGLAVVAVPLPGLSRVLDDGVASRGQYAGRLADIGDDFFPIQQRSATLQPEPGCSSPTFIGSAADLAALSGHMFEAALRAVASEHPSELAEPMVAVAVRLDGCVDGKMRPALTALAWPNDVVAHDRHSGYEIRISRPALAGLRTEVRRGARIRGPRIETGGLLLGQVDHACRRIWIDDVSGPPPDSLLSEVHFDHGIEGVPELVEYHRHRTGKLSTFVGIWHSHPFGQAEPSRTDKAAMTALVSPVSAGPATRIRPLRPAPDSGAASRSCTGALRTRPAAVSTRLPQPG